MTVKTVVGLSQCIMVGLHVTVGKFYSLISKYFVPLLHRFCITSFSFQITHIFLLYVSTSSFHRTGNFFGLVEVGLKNSYGC